MALPTPALRIEVEGGCGFGATLTYNGRPMYDVTSFKVECDSVGYVRATLVIEGCDLDIGLAPDAATDERIRAILSEQDARTLAVRAANRAASAVS